MGLHTKMRLTARKVLAKRDWAPIEAWDDERYDRMMRRLKTGDEELALQREACADPDGPFAEGPTFSFIVPLFETPREYLLDMAESVLAQTYPRLELVLVNASPDLEELRGWVDELAAGDARVKHVKLDGNFGITENTNRGIAAAAGDFLCFLDHDDWIEPDTLYEYVRAIDANDQIDLLYCDEDIVVRAGNDWRYLHPFFKPDFSPEHLLCKNYIIHLLTVRKSIVDAMPTPGPEFDGSQDYNMTLYASEKARCVHHAPKVLYHWRMSETSTAANSLAKPYAKKSNRLAVRRHLDRTTRDAWIIGSGITSLHNIWFRPDDQDKVSVVVDARNGADAFLAAFSQTNSYPNYEIVLVGQKSDEPAGDCPIDPAKIVSARADAGVGLLEAFNAGAAQASGDLLLFMGTDCSFATAEPLEQLIGLHRRAGVGIVAPRVLYTDYTVKSYGVGVTGENVMPLYRGYESTYPSYHCSTRAFQNASATSWQGLSVKRALFEQAGAFDTSFSGEIGAADLCQRVLRTGNRIAIACTIELMTEDRPPERRFDASTNSPDFSPAEIAFFYTKWPDIRSGRDPYISPFLDQKSGYPSISSGYLGLS